MPAVGKLILCVTNILITKIAKRFDTIFFKHVTGYLSHRIIEEDRVLFFLCPLVFCAKKERKVCIQETKVVML